MDQNCHYFRMKVGKGNCLFHYALSQYQQDTLIDPAGTVKYLELEEQAKISDNFYFFLGFDRDSQNLIAYNAKSNHFEFSESNPPANICYYNPSRKKYHPDDLFWLALSGTEDYREKINILVFGQKYLFLFKATGKISPLPDSRKSSIISHEHIAKDIAQALSLDYKKNQFDEYRSQLGRSAFLPVKLIGKVQRKSLPPAIDSLSVFQWLNQGTFRPLCSCGKSRESAISTYYETLGQSKLVKVPAMVIEKTPSEASYTAQLNFDAGHETTYSAIVRLVLNAIFFQKDLPIPAKDLLPLLISPSQLEAAAAILLLDLGYMPDSVNGGGLDFVDVRGRSRGRPTTSQILLRDAMGLDDREFFQDTLQFQCKDYEYHQNAFNDKEFPILRPLPDGKENMYKFPSLSTVIQRMKNLKESYNCDFLLMEWWQSQAMLFHGKLG